MAAIPGLLVDRLGLPARAGEGLAACRVEAGPLCLSPGTRSDCERLAAPSLSAGERAALARIGGGRRGAEWILGRLAAKEAVRMALAGRGLDPPPAAAIEIAADEAGRPLASGEALLGAGAAIALSLAHTGPVAVAIASLGSEGIGIDLEDLSRPRGPFEQRAFAPAELLLLGPPGTEEFLERRLRLWCAKEAVAKALGSGLMGSPLHLEVEEAEPTLERIRLLPRGALARALRTEPPPSCAAITWRDGGCVLAVSRIATEGAVPGAGQGSVPTAGSRSPL